MAMLMATAESLRWLGRKKEDADLVRGGDAIEGALRDLLSAGAPLTYDLVGEDKAASMTAVTDAIIERLSGQLA
jgi:isocitrate/isopropylmalate dehydrogenase